MCSVVAVDGWSWEEIEGERFFALFLFAGGERVGVGGRSARCQLLPVTKTCGVHSLKNCHAVCNGRIG